MSLILTKDEILLLKEIEKKVSWLSAWMIHNANNIRPSLDGLKVGGHQASSTSVISILVFGLHFLHISATSLTVLISLVK